MSGGMDFLRQKGILDPEEILFPVTVIGAGGIGSFMAPVLAKMGVSELSVYDPDTVEAHNLPNQMFKMSDMGRYKVDALRDIVLDMTGVKMRTFPVMFPNGDKLKGIVVSGVDSMKSREMIWDEVVSGNDVNLYVDARLGGEVVEVITVRPSFRQDRKFYKEYLFPDSEAAVLPCTARNIVYNGSVVAGLAASQIKKWIRQEQFPRRISFCLKTFELLEAE